MPNQPIDQQPEQCDVPNASRTSAKAHEPQHTPNRDNGVDVDKLTTEKQIRLLFKIEEAMLGSFMRPVTLVLRFWKPPIESDQWLKQRGLKRMGFLELWRRRKEADRNIEVAIEHNFAKQIVQLFITILMLLYSILQVLAQKAPGVPRVCKFGTSVAANYEFDFTLPIVGAGNTFDSQWVPLSQAELQAGRGYQSTFGPGMCAVSQNVTATLNQSSLTQTLAWVVSSIGIVSFAYAFLMYFASGSVAVLLQQVREGEPLPSFRSTKQYYSNNRYFIAALLILVFSMILGLAIVVFFPTIGYLASNCPSRVGSSKEVWCYYGFPSLESQWAVFIACTQVAWSCALLIWSINALMDQLRDPFQLLPPRAVLLDKHTSVKTASASSQAETDTSSILSKHVLENLNEESRWADLDNEFTDRPRKCLPCFGNSLVSTECQQKENELEKEYRFKANTTWAVQLLDGSRAGFDSALQQQIHYLSSNIRPAKQGKDSGATGEAPIDNTKQDRVSVHMQHKLNKLRALIGSTKGDQAFEKWKPLGYLRFKELLSDKQQLWADILVVPFYRAAMCLGLALMPLGLIWIVTLLFTIIVTHP
jgi:hypothetical protein